MLFVWDKRVDIAELIYIIPSTLQYNTIQYNTLDHTHIQQSRHKLLLLSLFLYVSKFLSFAGHIDRNWSICTEVTLNSTNQGSELLMHTGQQMHNSPIDEWHVLGVDELPLPTEEFEFRDTQARLGLPSSQGRENELRVI